MDEKPLSVEDILTMVGEFTHDSFLSEDPYLLLQEIPDDLTRERVRTALRNQAKKCKISMKSFDLMANSATKGIKKTDEIHSGNADTVMKEEGELKGLDAILSDKPDFGRYLCTDSGVYKIVGQFGIPVKICGHPVFPTKRYVNIETGSELLDVSYKLDGKWKTKKLVDRKVISQSRTIVALSEYGMGINSENAKDMVTYFSEMDSLNRDIIPRKETVSHLGWVQDRGFSPYIEGVEYDSGGKFSEAFESVRSEGSYEKWVETAAKVMTEKRSLPARIVLAASFASIVLKWSCQQPFMVHLWSSESGTGKTISLMLAASVWANPELGLFMRSMNATKVANEQLASFCNNMPLILDELQTIQKNTDFDDIIYMLCEGTGKARGTKDGGLREQTRWLNTIITNGEQPISTNSRAGAVNRVISIHATEKIIPGDMSDFADTLRDNYGWAGKRMIDMIRERPDFDKEIKSVYNTAMKQLVQYVTGKQANYGAALLVGDALMNAYIFKDYHFKPLTPTDILPYLATSEMADTNEKIRSWLIGFIILNSAKFRKWDDDSSKVYGDVYGEIEQDGSVKVLRSLVMQKMKEQGWTPFSFMNWCKDRNMIITNYCSTNRHWHIQARIKGTDISAEVFHFAAKLFKEKEVPVDVEVPFDT